MSSTKSLVIVESPAKAKTINRYLGSEYVVASSVGHVRDLPSGKNRKTTGQRRTAGKTRESPEKKIFRRMGVDPLDGWKASYEIVPGKEKVIRDLQKLAAKSDTVYLATDMDREGEAIAWHLQELLSDGSNGKAPENFHRVVFNEITRRAVTKAFADCGQVDMNRVNAQQARRFLDRLVGFMISPLLWEKIARGLSAGRVQSVALRLVVEREREIRAFNPEEYWEVHADLETEEDATALRTQWKKHAGKNFRPASQEEVDKALAQLEGTEFLLHQREDKQVRENPGPPLITAALQQLASTQLGYGVRRTMALAQRLYEAGAITYMRTDSFNLSTDSVTACREWIRDLYGENYLPEKPRFYSSKRKTQDAHEAIRPTDVQVDPKMLQNAEEPARRLYTLIRNRFIACQMLPARYTHTTFKIHAGEAEFRATGRVLLFDGFTRVVAPQKKKTAALPALPDLNEGEKFRLLRLEPTQHFTRPPPRYTEAGLVRELEKRGIGRPSTYASIISTIQERGYVSLDAKRFHAEKIGDIVTDRLIESFPGLMDYQFTAALEESLDRIAEGEADWQQILNDFYSDFSQRLENASNKEAGMRGNTPVLTEISCPQCSLPMQIRHAATGVFLGCSGYAGDEKTRCKKTLNLINERKQEKDSSESNGEREEEKEDLRTMRRCPECDVAMEAFLIDAERRLHICGNSPNCLGHSLEKGKFHIQGYDGPELECDRCGKAMELRSGRFGKYFACTNEECNNTRKLLKNGQPAPPKMIPIAMPELSCSKVKDHFVLRDGAAGLFLAASNFPRNRETRAPLVEELLAYRDQLDKKYIFLTGGPAADPEGNKAQIRYSRKNAEHYLSSEKNGKATGWRAYYRDGAWQAERTKSRSSRGRKTDTT